MTVNVQAVNQAPIGSLEKAADETDGDQTILRGGTLIVEGWAADPDSSPGAPVAKVEIRLNGAVVGEGTLGISRPDIAQKNNRPDYTNSGFKFSYDTKNLQPGDYAVVAIAFDSKGASTNLGSKTISLRPSEHRILGSTSFDEVMRILQEDQLIYEASMLLKELTTSKVTTKLVLDIFTQDMLHIARFYFTLTQDVGSSAYTIVFDGSARPTSP
ncbi:MAG: Ig-like domain-containing protein [Elusimicrobia bacterium]|nr:Ig-like domain-containing protein [Elusimicrobiota bacterium]